MAASMPAATCGPAGRGCASWLSTRKARASCPTFLVAERHKAKVCDVLLVLIGGGLLHGKLGHRARLSLWQNAKKPRFCGVLLVLIGGIVPPVGERGGGCFRKWALDASVARRAKA